MDMEVVEESTMGSSDQAQIVKGKRTKRQRPASPLMGSSSSSTPTTSLEFAESTEEEDKDMANCLILLAQGHSGQNLKRIEENYNTYECKTCNRCFPSFQALGGHRASHKKPKSSGSVLVEEKPAVVALVLQEYLHGDESQFNNNSASPPNHHQYDHHLQMGHRGACNSTGNYRAKVHECSICGSEFSSGQALGGHMRRHRATITTNATVTSDPQRPNNKQRNNVLALDLNLPAPEDDRDSKFSFASKQQPLVFSASALVDCYY